MLALHYAMRLTAGGIASFNEHTLTKFISAELLF